MSIPRVNAEFGVWVDALLKEHGLSLRAARIKTGIDHVTLSDMRSGYVPRMERVVQFARAFGVDVNDALTRAGYAPVEAAPSGALELARGIFDLQRRYPDRRVPLPRFQGGAETLTVEAAQAILQELESYLESSRSSTPEASHAH